MMVVGECKKQQATEGASSKKHPFEQISQVEGTTTGRTSGERV